MFTWILAQWEEYHTGIMLYGNSFYGVLEANYCIAALHLITFAVGPQLWRLPATTVLPIKQLEGVREWLWWGGGGRSTASSRGGSGSPSLLPRSLLPGPLAARRAQLCAHHVHDHRGELPGPVQPVPGVCQL